MNIRVFTGDITAQAADAIVNAANSALRKGGGIDGAIRTAAGPEIEHALSTHRWLSEGTAIITPAFRLPATWVIHTVAPRWQAGSDREQKADLFRSCHRASLDQADQIGAKSVAFPAIGTGAFGWPVEAAADVAFEAIADWLEEKRTTPINISFVCPNEEFTRIYRHLCEDWTGQSGE